MVVCTGITNISNIKELLFDKLISYAIISVKQHKFDTKPDTDRIWRENLVFRKLHFTQKIKTKIVEYILLRFEDNEKRVTTD